MVLLDKTRVNAHEKQRLESHSQDNHIDSTQMCRDSNHISADADNTHDAATAAIHDICDDNWCSDKESLKL